MGLTMRVLGQVVLFSFVFGSIGPLEVSYLLSKGNALESVMAFLLFSPTVLVLYSAMKLKASYGGLYDQIKAFLPNASMLFAVFWTTSYFLYLCYTVYFITYYILPLSGAQFIATTLSLIGLISLVALLDLEPYSVVPLSLLQLVAMIPIPHLWSPKHVDLTVSLSSVASSSLLPVCITLSSFLGQRLAKDVHVLPMSYALASGLAVIDSLFAPANLTYLFTSVSSLGLILVEFFAVKNVLVKSFGWRKSFVVGGFVALSLAGLVDPSAYYNYLIVPSLIALYASLSIFFASASIYYARKGSYELVFSSLSTALMVYGLYISLTPLLT